MSWRKLMQAGEKWSNGFGQKNGKKDIKKMSPEKRLKKDGKKTQK